MAPQVVSMPSAVTFAFMTLLWAPFGDGQSLIQRSHKISVVVPNTPHGGKHADQCVNLVNHGTHATVDVEVGTPGQKFSVVADTGSDALIIPSCICQRIGSCDTDDRCFLGRNHSRTFHMAHDPDAVTLSFGSGIIEAVPVKDVVRVGPLHKYMGEDGLLLMLSKYLSFSGPFEGILGLGPPPVRAGPRRAQELHGGGASKGSGAAAGTAPDEALEKVIEDVVEEVEDLIDSLGGGNQTSAGGRHGGAVLPRVAKVPERHAKSNESWETYKGFIEQAKMDNFSVCLDETHGVMRFDVPTASRALGSVGTYHWSLHMQGISVGGASAPVLFCDPAGTKHGKHGNRAPCAAIPDSGSTHIMGPPAQLEKLFDSICDNWPRCARNHTALVEAARQASEQMADTYSFDPFNITGAVMSKAEIFQLLLLDCERWMVGASNFDELPPFHVHLGGSHGNQTLEIPGQYYIMESSTKDYDYVYKHFKEFGHDSSAPNSTHYRKVCTPAMSPFEMTSQEHGDVWILGTPLFYRYVVSYKIEPPQMSFTSTAETPCGACGDGVGFVSSGAAPGQRRPRKAAWPIRRPSIDVDMPL